jgi:hypothetical protein
MTVHLRPLLQQGNLKLGQAIHTFSLPAVVTCPGRSSVCERVCYAQRHRYRFQAVIERLVYNFQQCRRRDFVPRVVREIRCKGCLVIRVHVSGDFFSTDYAEKWLGIMKRCPGPRYYWYSRSWRVPEIREVLEQMAMLRQCRCWYSVDSETGLPEHVPDGVRLAYLQVRVGEQPELADLVFRARGARRERIPLSLACPSETPQGRSHDMNCGFCTRCWR